MMAAIVRHVIAVTAATGITTELITEAEAIAARNVTTDIHTAMVTGIMVTITAGKILCALMKNRVAAFQRSPFCMRLERSLTALLTFLWVKTALFVKIRLSGYKQAVKVRPNISCRLKTTPSLCQQKRKDHVSSKTTQRQEDQNYSA